MTPDSPVAKESMACSVMTVHPPKVEDRGHSPRSPTEISFRDKLEQVSKGRFEPQLFDANIQTDRELLELYLMKETHDKVVEMTPRS